MNGAITVPCVMKSKEPTRKITNIIGVSQSFFLVFKKDKNSNNIFMFKIVLKSQYSQHYPFFSNKTQHCFFLKIIHLFQLILRRFPMVK